MSHLTAYIKLPHQAREAMEFYKEAFGGELLFMTVGESPMGANASEEDKKAIMHSSLVTPGFTIFASDMVGDQSPTFSDNLGLCFTSNDTEELKRVFAKLSEGGNVTTDLRVESFGVYGDLRDKYGVPWMFQSDKMELA